MVSTPNGTISEALTAADVAHIVAEVNRGCIGFHVWPSHADDLEHADELHIDVDASPGVTFGCSRRWHLGSAECSMSMV